MVFQCGILRNEIKSFFFSDVYQTNLFHSLLYNYKYIDLYWVMNYCHSPLRYGIRDFIAIAAPTTPLISGGNQ